MKLMPASRALATIRIDVASSVGPPNIMVPRQIGEIFRPLRPRLRYCISVGSSRKKLHFVELAQNLKAAEARHLSRRERVGVRGYGPSICRNPSPGSQGRSDLSPRER